MLLDGGSIQDIHAIVKALPVARQTLCFSATVPEKMLPVLTMAMRPEYVTVDCVGDAPPSHTLIEQTVVIHTLERSLLALYVAPAPPLPHWPHMKKQTALGCLNLS